jgi:hypothetical protein
MPGSPLDIAGQIGSIAGPIVGSIAGQNGIQWLQGLLASIYANGGTAQKDGKTAYDKFINDFYGANKSGNDSLSALLFGPNGQFAQTTDQINGINSSIPSIFGNTGAYKGANTDYSNLLRQVTGSTSGTQDLANQVFAGGGWTPQGQQGFDQISKLFNSSLPGTQSGTNTMDSILNSGGGSDFTRAFQNAGRQSLSDGGMTPTLNAAGAPLQGILGANGDTANNDILRQFGLDALTSGGYTKNSQAGSNSALQTVLNGGNTAQTDALQGRGLQLLGREALLPMQQVISMARDQAGADSIAHAEKAYREAQNRGGGPGSTVANGLQNQAYADFADQSARNETDAAVKAMLGQQQLQQNEQLAGGQIATGGANAATARFGQGADLLSQLESGSTNRYNVGGNLAATANDNETKRLLSALGLIPDIQNSATNVMGTVGGLGLGAANSENNKLGIGADLLRTLSGNELSKNQIGLSSLSNLLSNQNQYALGAGNLSNNIANTQGNNLGTLLQNAIASGQLDLNTAVQLFGAFNQGAQNSIGNNNSLNNAYQGTTSAGQNMANPYMQYSLGGMNLQGGATNGGSAASQNPFAVLAGIGGR